MNATNLAFPAALLPEQRPVVVQNAAPGMNDPIDHGSLPWLFCVVLMSLAPHLGHLETLPFWLLPLAGFLLGWRLILWHLRRPLPARGWLVLIMCAAFIGLLFRYGNLLGSGDMASLRYLPYRLVQSLLLGRDAGIASLAILMAAKLMETKERRDAITVVMLSYFLLLTHYFYSQSIFTGLWLLASATLSTAALARVFGGIQPPRFLLRTAAKMLLQGLPFALLMFVLVPRVSGPLWGIAQPKDSGMTGLSDSMTPGVMASLIEDGAVAFRVRFLDPSPNAVPEPAQRYWRGPVFDHFDGSSWSDSFVVSPRQARHDVAPLAPEIAYEITLEAHGQRWLLSLDLPSAAPEGREARWGSQLQLMLRQPLYERERFTLRSATRYRANVIEVRELIEESLRLPRHGNPRARALGREWRRTLQTPQAVVDAALKHLREENFVYTLYPGTYDGDNTIDDFFFIRRRGFCEHYASAFVFLMRAAGVPARVVTGYQGGEINPVDGYMTVRQSDAHAWAEVWIGGQGWIRVDPTAAVSPLRIETGISAALAPEDRPPGMLGGENPWVNALRQNWEALNNFWNQWVLGYDPARQKTLLEQMGFSDTGWRGMALALAGSFAVLLCLFTLWALRRPGNPDPVERDWQRFCRWLARRGITREAWEGPLDFSERIRAHCRAKPNPANQHLARLADHIALHYSIARYGQPETRATLAAQKALHNAVRRLNRRRGVVS
ncbi:MAG: DUF3488 and transglutaminase-like domain-containing protein [Betaproteobacteria bacterium]|nr:DUF3488 and transglutaminase-like domain-containing protein [Betaproteobacteria bacterium]